MRATNIVNRLQTIKINTKIPWEGLYSYWFGFVLNNNKEIYRNNKIMKLLEVPRKFQYKKEIIVKYRDIKMLWEEEKGKNI
jgi:hypothetical protein